MAAESSLCNRHHGVTNGEAVYSFSYVDDPASTLCTERSWVARIKIERIQHIPEVQCGGVDANLDFTRGGPATSRLLKLQFAEVTALCDIQFYAIAFYRHQACDFASRALPDDQIGRASCRERV